jgi:hypothetical protein
MLHVQSLIRINTWECFVFSYYLNLSVHLNDLKAVGVVGVVVGVVVVGVIGVYHKYSRID